NLMNILVRADKEKTKNPVAFPAALKWRVQDFADMHPFLEAIMKPFQAYYEHNDVTFTLCSLFFPRHSDFWTSASGSCKLKWQLKEENQINSSLESLRKERGTILLHKVENEKETQSLFNIGNILARCKRKLFANPVAFPVALKWKIRDFCDINPFLNAIMKQFKDTLLNELQLKKGKFWGQMEERIHGRDGELVTRLSLDFPQGSSVA
ncbi:hypothetical protein lerEdw1_010942, partial [Lerista edwardsae]